MRRTLPIALRSTPEASVPSSLPRADGASCLLVELDLDCITPVIGGGVEPYEPDRVDVVRVHGIRGQLRAFWRALAPSSVSPTQLLEQESALWGGVIEPQARRSQVEIRVEVDPARQGREVPAGWHEPRPNGGFSALPKWLGDRALGYALFPLQRPRKELDELRNMPRAPTRSVREALGFTLRLRVAALDKKKKEKAQRDIKEADRLLGALFCWVHLGGLGGRTTRGFGALALRVEPKIESPDGTLTDCTKAWQQLFRAPQRAEDVGRWLRDGLGRAGVHREAPFSWPTLHGVELLAGPAQSSAEGAHALLLAELQAFRQGERLGRDPGAMRGRPGRSRWPEPDTLRRLAEDHGKPWLPQGRHRWAHPPRVPNAEACAPRAAFGLPIVVSFKDPDDAVANATIELATGSDKGAGARWTSPLRLRPLRCADGRWVPLVIALSRRPGEPGQGGDKVRIHFKKASKGDHDKAPKIPIRGNSGAQPPIAGYLSKNNGDAVSAFLGWLQTDRRFTRMGGGA